MIKSDFTPDFVRSDLDFAILYFLFLIHQIKNSSHGRKGRLYL